MFSCSLFVSFPEKSKLEPSCAWSHRLTPVPAVLHSLCSMVLCRAWAGLFPGVQSACYTPLGNRT